MDQNQAQDKINVLPSHVANQIAAGEVVQRPCSIIKELIENSVDAGACNIQVVIEEGGMSLIQVVDDGMGMSGNDAQKAFLRHATSKIRKAEDLFALHTFGFRGEALASIAAVAQVELRTRRVIDELGWEVSISGSSEVDCSSTSTPKGTNIVARNLFYNIPARRKFLKTTAYETRLVITEFQRIALVNPDISFSLRTSASKSPLVLAAGNLHQRIVAITTKSLGGKLLPIEVDTPVVRLGGYIGTQAASRKGSSEQYFFVNGRYISSPYLQKAVVSAYGKLLSDGTLPSYFIYIEVDPSSLDVNIHPTKTQVKFSDEQLIWQVINAAVRQTLGKHNVVPSLDFTNQAAFDIPAYNQADAAGAWQVKVPKTSSCEPYNPFLDSYQRDEMESAWNNSPTATKFDGDPEKAPFTEMIPPQLLNIDYSDADAAQTVRPISSHQNAQMEDYLVESSQFDDDSAVVQGKLDMAVEQKLEILIHNNRYIVMTTVDGIVMVDYYRAMGRIAYEQALGRKTNDQQHGERLIQPETIALSAIDHQTLLDNQQNLAQIGIEIGDMGQNTIAIYSLPINKGARVSAQDMINSLLHDISEQGNSLIDNAVNRLALALCRSYYHRDTGSVTGHKITKQAAQILIDQLFACEEPSLTPDSLPIIEIISPQEIIKRFKR